MAGKIDPPTADRPSPRPDWLIAGVDHVSGPHLLQERLQGDDADRLRLMEACRAAGLKQAAIVATCDRCDVWCASDDLPAANATIGRVLAEAAGMEPAEIAPHIARRSGSIAIRHAFAVASSLESRTVGEPQVLAQVKDAHRLAGHLGMLGSELDALFQHALRLGKQVRTETPIARHSVSMAAGVVRLARQVFGAPAPLSGLILGDSDLGELVVEHLVDADLSRWTVLHRNPGRAAAWARRHNAHAGSIADLAKALPAADIVLGAMDAPAFLLEAGAVEAALKARRRRPMLLIDLSVPGDLDPAIDRLEDAFLYGLTDLERLAVSGRREREAAALDAWRMVEAGVTAFERHWAGREAVPLVVALREHFEAERVALLESNPGLDANEATRRLVNRLLHHPLTALKDAPPDAALEANLRRIFTTDKP